MTMPADDRTPMPSDSTRSMFLVVAGFGIGALVMIAGFGVVLGLGGVEHGLPAAAPTVQTSATAPAAAPQAAPNAPAPATTGQAPANSNAPKAQSQPQPAAPAQQQPAQNQPQPAPNPPK